MKRFIPVVLFFILLLSGCTFAPFDSTDYVSNLEVQTSGLKPLSGIFTDPNNQNDIIDIDNETGDVEGIIYVYFNDYLDAGTVDAVSFKMSPNGASATIDTIIVKYEKEFKRVKIQGTFGDNATYTLKIVADEVKSLGGNYLDGNGNSIEDGSPYDDMFYQFSTSGSTTWEDYVNPIITNITPKKGDIDVAGTFSVSFSELVESIDVVQNVKLYREKDAKELDIELDSYVWSGMASTWVATFSLTGVDSLAQREIYYLEVECKEITDSAGNPCLHPSLPKYTSDIPTLNSRFLTQSFGTDDDTPPSVNTWSYNTNSTFFTVSFNDSMDVATLTNNNIRFYANFGEGFVFVPGEIYVHPNHHTIEYSLINVDWNSIQPNPYVIISNNVTDDSDKKWGLDSNNNGIGGEEADLLRFLFPDSDNQKIVFP